MIFEAITGASFATEGYSFSPSICCVRGRGLGSCWAVGDVGATDWKAVVGLLNRRCCACS